MWGACWPDESIHHYLDKASIILTDGDKILQSRCYQEIKEYCNIIKRSISEYCKEQHTCIGVLMNHSVYAPAIILRYNKMFINNGYKLRIFLVFTN